MRMEAQMQATPPQARSPGLRPPPLQWELPVLNHFPHGFRPPFFYNEALHPQSCPPGFRPPVQHAESLTILQPETNFLSGDSMNYSSEFRLDDRQGDHVGIHDFMWGSSMCGAADRHGWYPNESSSGAGRVCGSGFVDSPVSKPSILPRGSQHEHVPNLYRGAGLENENRRRETHLQHGQPNSASVPVLNVTPPLASYLEAFWPGKFLASTREAGKRRSFEVSDDTSPPFKRLRTGHEVGSPTWARSRRESEMSWSNGLQMYSDHEASHSSSLHTQKQTERKNETESSSGIVNRWHDRQESRTRCSPPHYQRGLLSHRDRNRVPISLEVFQKSELCSRPSSFRPISQSDRSSLRASPRPVYSSGKEEQYRNNPCFDARRRAPNRGSWSPSLRSRSPKGRSNYYRRSLRAREPSWRRESWPPCLLAGKSSSEAGTDKYVAYWRSADSPDKVNSKAEEDGSWTTLLSARVGGEHAKDDRSRRGSQFLDVVSKQKSQQCGTEGSVALKASISLDNMAPASTDRIKNEKAFSLPLSAGTIQKLPEMKPKADQCRSLEKNLPLLRNSSQFSDEKAGSSFAKHMTTFGENQSAGLQSISATSLKRTRYFTNTRSAPKYCASQDSEMDWKISPEKMTHQGRRTAVVSAGPLLVKTSGSDEESALPAEEQDEAEEGEILHTENTFKPILDSRLLLESSSIASETGIIEGGLIKPFIGLSGVSFEATVHPLSTVDGTDNQVTTVKVGSCGNQRAGKKWIFTGVRSKYIPSVKLLKTASGSDLQTPESLGKSQTPGGCLLAEDTPDCSCSQQMEEVSPTSTVRNGRVSFHVGIRKLSDQLSVPRSNLSSLDKDDEIWTAGKIKSDIFFFKDSSTVPETEKPKLSFMVEKSLQESPVHGQNLERDYFINSGTEDQPGSSFRSSVGDVTVNPVVGKSGSLFDECRFGITSSIPLVIEANKGFQPNSSTSESSHVSVKSELQDSLTSEGDMQTEKLSGLFREKTTSVIEVAKIVTDKKKTALVQGEQDAKVVSQSSDMRDASAREGDKLARQLDREDRRQGNPTTKLATVLTNTGASLVTKRTAVMSIVPQRSDLQDLTNPGGNTRAEQQGKVSVGGSGPATKLVSVITGEGEATPTDSEDDFEVITESSRDAVTTVLDFDRELGKRRKIMNPEKRVNLKQAMIADDPTAKVMKTNVFESSSGTGKIKADLILMKKQMSSLKGGFQRIVPVLKTVDTLPLSSQVSAPSAVIPPLRTLGRSYMTNKTWRREATPVSGLQFSSTPQNPAVVAQPSIYVRKNFSIIRYPASQVPLQSNAGAQPNALSRFPQGSIIQSRNKKYSLSASKSMGHYQVNTIIAKTAVVAAAAASPNLKTSISKMSGLGAMPSKKPSPSLVRRLHSVEDGTLVTCSESIASDLPPVSEISPSKPSYCEGSGGLTTLVCSPVSKSPRRATDEMVGYVVSRTRLYRKRKLDQVCVGPSTTSPSPILRPGLEKCDVPLGYIKWKTNQLVRCDHPEASANDALRNAIEGGDQVKCMTRQRRYSTQLMTKTKLGRALSKKRGRLLGFARVWTLSNEGKRTTTALGTCRGWWNPLFPWKRSNMVVPRLRRGRPSHDGKMGALFFHISNQLQKYRSAHPVYTRSADGFSLHRSGVMSKSGANLKWTKSLKTQSILASEAATKVVAEVAKRKRDKKEAVVMAVAKARDERRLQPLSGIGSVDSSSVSSLKPLGIGGTVYVRKGFGNKLVRNSKTVARVVAGEKFRWSLRNARLRRAKKQAFCVYYTRFGVCKRGDGRCLYIHDPEKVAICTKFLRGSCSDPACCLTHKVIPERMSDCSYFLEGLCTNESCPYRHVNVNKEAPVCEAFLRGYCADGDECNKKHTYVCPDYTLRGICTSSNCKLRHPKKTTQLAFASKDSVDSGKEAKKGSKRELKKGRYFTCRGPAEGNHQGLPVSSASAVVDKIGESGDDLVDFISIDEYDSESSKEYQDMDSIISKCYQTMEIYPSNYL